jgi:hypothetical protein
MQSAGSLGAAKRIDKRFYSLEYEKEAKIEMERITSPANCFFTLTNSIWNSFMRITAISPIQIKQFKGEWNYIKHCRSTPLNVLYRLHIKVTHLL